MVNRLCEEFKFKKIQKGRENMISKKYSIMEKKALPDLNPFCFENAISV